MNHNHTHYSDERDAFFKSQDVDVCKPDEEVTQKQSYLFESMNGKPEEIPTEELKIDVNNPISEDGFEGQGADMAGMTDDQEHLLNCTHSGLDVSMVQTILGNQSQMQKNRVSHETNDTDARIIKECSVDRVNGYEPEVLETTITTDEAFIETIQQTDNISTIIENRSFSQKMELEGMRNPADYRNRNNQSYESISEESVLICSSVSGMESLQSKISDGYKETSKTQTTTFKKITPQHKALYDSLKQLIVQYPLVSEYELFERLKMTDEFYGIKMSKKRFVKILERLRLGNSYERFRYFVKA